jgi:hypothetical protein
MSNTHVILADSDSEKKIKCDWEGCQGNPHSTAVEYKEKNNGCVTRGDYKGNWPRPFHILTSSYTEYGVKKGKYKGLVSSREEYQNVHESNCDHYETQFHHIIPVDVMEGLEVLGKNLVLIGWNINDGMSNGICLPYFKEDQIWHYLQPHRGEHPGTYISDVKNVVSKIQSASKELCRKSEDKKSQEDQNTLKVDIQNCVNTIRDRILNWKIKIHLEETLTGWADMVAKGTTIGKYYHDETGKRGPVPMEYKSKKLGSRKYIE